METILKMLNVLAWITVVWTGIVVAGKVISHLTYRGSLRQKLDTIEGKKITFLHNLIYWFIAFIISLSYLIAK